MERFIKQYCRFIEFILFLMMVVLVVLVFGNVVLRYIFNSGLTITEEMGRWIFVWMVFLGAIVAIRDRAHLGSDVLISRLGHAGKKVCLVCSQLLMLYVNWLLFLGSLEQARLNVDVGAPVTGLPVAIFYSTGVVFAVSAGLLIIFDTWRTLSGKLTDEELVMVKESEELAHINLHEGERMELRSKGGGAPTTAVRN